MARLLIVLLLSLGFSENHGVSAPNWTWDNPVLHGVDLRGVWTSPHGEIFAAGSKGTIVQLSPNGQLRLLRRGTERLNAIWGLSHSEILAVGDVMDGTVGVILQSHDAGRTWQNQGRALPGLNTITGSSDGKLLVVAGASGSIFVSHNDAMTWNPVTSGTKRALYGASIAESGTLFVVGDDGHILRSSDRGETWNRLQSRTSETLYAICGIGQHLFAVGDAIVHSTDGGETWHEDLAQATRNEMKLRSVLGIKSDQGEELFAVGQTGTILRLPLFEAGRKGEPETWKNIGAGSFKPLYGVSGNSYGTVVAVGMDGTVLSYVAPNWVTRERGFSDDLRGIWGCSQDRVFAVGSAGVWRTRNQGRAWTFRSITDVRGLNAIWGLSCDREIYIVGDRGAIYISRDEGVTWDLTQSGTNNDLSTVWGDDAGDVFVGGEDGTILRSNDQGHSWARLQSGIRRGVRAIWGRAANDIWAVGMAGTILHSKDRGQHWTRVPSLTDHALNGIWGDPKRLFAVGSHGVLLVSSNGKKWDVIPTKTTVDLTSIRGSARGIYAVGQEGVILLSSNGGTSWTMETIDHNQSWSGVWGRGRVFVVGSTGAVLHTDEWGPKIEM